MSTSPRICDITDSTANQNEVLTSFWGLGCLCGNQYSQVVQRRFRLTKAVLDPSSYSKDEKNKIVKVKVIHRGYDFLLCILKHEEIYQVSLNLVFEKGEKVIFFIEGHGKVYLSGFEVIDSANATPWDESVSVDITKGMKTSSPRKSTPAQSPKTVSITGSPSSDRKARRRAASDEINSGSFVCNGGMDEDDTDEDDEDFSVEDEESEEDDEESEVDESDLEDEIKLLEEEGTESIECNNGEEGEETAISDSTVSHKRKRQMLEQQPGKRTRKESVTIDDDVIICDVDSEPSYDTEQQKSSAGTTPISKNIPATESAEKKKKKKKKKKVDTSEPLIKLSKSPSSDTKMSPKMSKGGVQMQDIAVGKGPEAIKGKMVHIFYVGRMANKQIFDSRTHGKKPLSFRLGKKSVVRGLEMGIEGMKVGGKRKIVVPPSLGFGSATVDKVPPNTTLEFTVELLNVS